MGAWGTAIFADDLACDVRDQYYALLSMGKSDQEAYEIIMDNYKSEDLDEDEPVFWFALALSQWRKGRLMESVKEEAIKHI